MNANFGAAIAKPYHTTSELLTFADNKSTSDIVHLVIILQKSHACEHAKSCAYVTKMYNV